MAAARKKNMLDGVLYFLNIVLALALLASYLAYYFNPAWLSIFAFFALGYPVLLLLNFLFVIYWALRFKRKIFLSIVCILIGFAHLERLYQFSGSNKVVNPAEKLKVMSFNVRLFNAFKWLPGENIPGKIKKLVQKENPDVLLLQEYHDFEKTPSFDYKYKFSEPLSKDALSGLVIYSRKPFQSRGVMSFPSDSTGKQDRFAYIDLKWNGSTVRVINTHLASVGFEAQDYQRLQSPNNGSQEEIQKGFTQIIKRLHNAFEKRARQIKALEQAVDKSPHPIILAGDFNDVPTSYTYHRIALELNDSYLESGRGFGRTYTRGPVPLRIDYIFHSKEFRSFNYRTIDKKYSDHYPIITELEQK